MIANGCLQFFLAIDMQNIIHKKELLKKKKQENADCGRSERQSFLL